jgi:hypothetical protein
VHRFDQFLHLITAALGAFWFRLAVVLLECLLAQKSIMTVAAFEFVVGHGSARLLLWDVNANETRADILYAEQRDSFAPPLALKRIMR